MALRDYVRCKKCDAKIIYAAYRNEEDWEPFLLCRSCLGELERELSNRDETIRTLIGLGESATQQLTHLRNLVEYHMRREPVIDREIYCFRNVQGFAQSYKTLFDLPRETSNDTKA